MSQAPKPKFTPGFIFLFTILSIAAIDQLTKILAVKNLSPNQSVPIIKSIFHITLVFNKGGAFGVFVNAAAALIFISIIAILTIAVILFTLRRRRAEPVRGLRRGAKIALTCIMAGAISNLADRLRFGYVIDFLDFRIWPVFNVADTAITLGAIWLMWKFLPAKGR